MSVITILNRPPNKILLKPPKKKKVVIFQFCLIVCFLILIGFILNYLIFANDLVNYPYFPSNAINLLNHGLAGLCAILVGCLVSLFGISMSSELLSSYHRQKITRFVFGSFLYFAVICFGIFFGRVFYSITYDLAFAINSQLAKNIGTLQAQKIQITAQSSQNPLYGQTIKVKRGKVYKHIIDPVAYRIQIRLKMNDHAYSLEPYCYTQESKILKLSTASFTALGKRSMLGFRCTANCELHAYFQVDDGVVLSSHHLTQCSRIYSQQSSID